MANYHSDEWIMNGVREHYEEAKQYFDESRIVGIFYQGSANYGLDYENSDIDTKLIVTPTFEDIVFNKRPVSTTHVRANNEHIDFKDIRLYIETFRKQNVNFLEILFTPYKIVNPQYEQWWNRLIENREAIAHYDIHRAIKTMSGIALEKYQAMEHKYPSKVDIIEKYGYDCYHPNTKFLTQQGWKRFDEVLNTDLLGTVNPTTLQLEWQKPIAKIKKQPTAQMYEGETYNTHFCITETHNVFTSKIININKNGNKYKEELANWQLEPLKDCLSTNRHRHILSFPTNYNPDNTNFSDDILKLFGAFIAEGTINFRDKEQQIPRAIRITQTKNGKIEFFTMMDNISNTDLNKYEYEKETVWILPTEYAVKFLQWSNHGSKNKRLPEWIYTLSQRQAQILLNAMILGDGTYHKSRTIYYTSSKKLAEDVCSLAYMAGYVANILGGEEGYVSTTEYTEELHMWQVQITNRTENVPTEMYFDTKERNRNGAFKKVENTEEVVCFTVPNGTLITMYKGKTAVQGNCKQLHHLMRIENHLMRYIAGESYEACLIPDEETAKKLRKVKEDNGYLSLEQARTVAGIYMGKINGESEKYLQTVPEGYDPEVEKLLKEVQYDIMKFAVALELKEDNIV